MRRPRLLIKPWPDVMRLLMMDFQDEMLRAVMPRTPAHPRAAATLCEGLALWIGHPLSVVLCADESGATSALGLCDGFGLGHETVHYQVEVVDPSRRPRGLGPFGDLRQLLLRGVR